MDKEILQNQIDWLRTAAREAATIYGPFHVCVIYESRLNTILDEFQSRIIRLNELNITTTAGKVKIIREK